MPIYGLGTYSLKDETCVNSVTAALGSGVRLMEKSAQSDFQTGMWMNWKHSCRR